CMPPVPPAGIGHPPHPAPPGPVIQGAAATVSVTGMPIACKNDQGMIICPPCPCNPQFTIQEGSSSVEAGGQAVARMGDKIKHMAAGTKQANAHLGMPG